MWEEYNKERAMEESSDIKGYSSGPTLLIFIL
jgi:hypothetical protein